VSAAPVEPRPASMPVDVCRHVREVASKDQLASNKLDAVERDCVIALEQLRKQYDTVASCLLDTSTAAHVAECEQGMRAGTDLLSRVDAKPTNHDVCSHLMDIMKREFGDSAVVPSDEEMAKFHDECVRDIEKERQKIGAEKFDEQVECVMAARRMEELSRCEEQ
jgi:hypothetical protein